MIDSVDQSMQRGEIGILLVRIEGHLVIVAERIEFPADARQPRRIGCGIAGELQLEVARAGMLTRISDATFAFNAVVEADSMPDSNARQRLPAREKLRDFGLLQIGRKPRIDAGDIAGHSV